MILSPKYNSKIKNLIASLLLGLFLWANYGVNFTHYHHHDSYHLSDSDNSKMGDKHCLVCHFQELFYEPLAQKNFQIERLHKEECISCIFSFDSFYFLEFYCSAQQRGPPIFPIV